jgi:inosine-uridine nucleoside N-ribohydrolase
MPDRHRLIIDCDPGVDDALALMLAFASPTVEVLGITAVFGNSNVAQTADNARRLCALAGRGATPVAPGAAVSLAGVGTDSGARVHGADGIGDTGFLLCHEAAAQHPQGAAEFIAAALAANPGEVTLLALGPLTNLAVLLRSHPGAAALARQVIVMGGNALGAGNITPAAEANVFHDAEAADQVFGAGWPLTMVGLDVTHEVLMTGAEIDALALADSPAGEVARQALPRYRRFYGEARGIDGVFLHDPTALAALLWPDLFDCRAWALRVETEGISRGKTWPDVHGTAEGWRHRPRVRVATRVRGDEVKRRMIERWRA